MDDRSNTIAGWVLGAGIVALGASLLTAEMFHTERPEKMGYPIEGVEIPGPHGPTADEPPIANLLADADVGKGQEVFNKCTACHTIDQGGGNKLGPNLWGIMGKPLASVPGFAYSPVLKEKGGTWTWEAMNDWIKSPRAFAPGTKMTFAGIGKAEDRANLLAFMNSKSGSPLPLPTPTVAEGNPAQAAAEAAGAPAQGDKGEKEPVMNEAQAAQGANIGGEGAPSVAGTAEQTKTKGH